LSEDQALLLAVVQYIATGGEPQSIPGKPGEPVPPVGVPPGGGAGTAPDTQLPGKSGDVPEIGGVPGQENKGAAGGVTTTTPIEDDQGPGLIFNQQEIITNTGAVTADKKIGQQLSARGWTLKDVQTIINEGVVGESLDKRSANKTPDRQPRDDSASVYGSRNGYIIVNNRTGEIVQVSDRNDPDWVVDGRIKWK
ncbi:colicin E5-related ribonuclease, partial [Achromobacter insolitus]